MYSQVKITVKNTKITADFLKIAAFTANSWHQLTANGIQKTS